jgi:hypothetical protein
MLGAPVAFTSPPPALPRGVIVLLVVVAVLAFLAFYVVSVVVSFNDLDGLRASDNHVTEPYLPLPQTEPADPTDPAPETSAGPRASTYPVREDDDLARVCDGWYYPQSPKFAGKAPHQISVGVVDGVVLPSRHMKSSVSVPDLQESIWRAWMPEDPAKSQLVACVDLVRSTGKLKGCTYDNPSPETVDLKKAFYRLRLYETATGRKLLDKQVTGEDEKCPSIVFLVGGESLYSEVSDRQLYEALRTYVMK